MQDLFFFSFEPKAYAHDDVRLNILLSYRVSQRYRAKAFAESTEMCVFKDLPSKINKSY